MHLQMKTSNYQTAKGGQKEQKLRLRFPQYLCCRGTVVASRLAHIKALWRLVSTAPKSPATLEDFYKTHCLQRAQHILKDSSHPGHHLFILKPSGRQL